MPSVFDMLPFVEAINSLRERLAMPKPEFIKLDAANRSRAFTMAWISDQRLLENIHDELSIAINNGETFADFEQRLEDLRERSGWTGTSPWHYRVVYDQNLGMAYSAGRVQQGQASGFKAWRYLPTISANPRPEHEEYYNQIYQMAPGTPVPPIDFGCNCGWEWVFPEELDAMGIDPASLPVFDPPVPKSGFVWSATDYFNLNAAVQANSEMHRDDHERCGVALLVNGALDAAPYQLQHWAEQAIEAAARIAPGKFISIIHLISNAERRLSLAEIRDAIADPGSTLYGRAMSTLMEPDEVKLDHQVTLAALLSGRLAVAENAKVRK